MSKETLELTRRAIEAWNRDDPEWIRDRITEDFELHPQRELFPDLNHLYVGKTGWMRFAEVWRGAWETTAVDVERIEDLGDDVLAILSYEGIGRGSGAPVSLTLATWFSFRDGRLTGIRTLSPDEALKAAGLKA